MSARQRLVQKNSKRKQGNNSNSVVRRRVRSKKNTGGRPSGNKVIPYNNKDVLKELLKGPDMGRFREGDYIHVSDLIYKCTRKIALSHRLQQPIDPDPVFDSQGLTFAQGEAIHDYITDKIIRKHPDKIYGMWSCSCGTTTQEGLRSDVTDSCNKCGTTLSKYGEIKLIDEELKITGSVDLSLLVRNSFLLTELKSMKHELWQELARPEGNHVIQILFYWYLARKLGLDLHDKVSVLYATKNYVFNNPYKEFVMCPSDELHKLDDYLEDARVLKAAIHDGGPLPPRLSCPTRNSPAAKDCQFCNVCFVMED